MRAAIRHHGTLEMIARATADRLGLTVSTTQLDVDPMDRDILGNPRPSDGRGVLIISRPGSGAVSIPYHLPEDPDDIVRLVQQVPLGDQMADDKRRDPGRRPIEVRP